MCWTPETRIWMANAHADDSLRRAPYWQARRYGARHGRAEDLAEDAVVEAISRTPTDAANGRFQNEVPHYRNWVRRTAVNWVHDQFSREAREERARERLLLFSRERFTYEQYQLLERIVHELPDEDRAIVQRYFEGWTYRELAEQYLPSDQREEISRINAIRRRLFALLEVLRRRLEEEGFDVLGD